MTIIKSRPATLTAWIPGAPRRCPACRRRVGRRFNAIYGGDPNVPETVHLVGWRCARCGVTHPADD